MTMSQVHSGPYLYGLDVGGTKIEMAIFDQGFNLVHSWRIPTPTQNYAEFLDAVAGLVKQADEKYQGVSLGIGMPGIIDKYGKVKSANVPCATGRYIEQDLKHKLQRELHVANDCRLFALSEAHGGAGEGMASVYGAILGTGAAGGLYLQGKLLESWQNIIGEYGHVSASAAVITKYKLPIYQCGCGLLGCYEAYIAGPGLGRLFQHFGAQSADSKLFVEQLRMGNDIACKTFECYMELLGAAFANLVLSYDPDVIVMGGGLSKVPEIIQALPKAIEEYLFTEVKVPPIKLAEFGDSSGVRGAAILAAQWQEC